MGSDPTYHEMQRFRQWWLWGLLGILALFMFGTTSVVGLVIFGVVAAFVFSLRLETEVRTDGIYVKMWPLHLSFRRISWSDIEHYESRTYHPIRDFGGWGIRWAPGKIAYNVSGNQGVLLHRPNDRDVLIGSQRAVDFVEAIEQASAH
jgi:hypothetical protein